MEYFKNPFFLLAIYGTAVFFLTFITRKIVETAKPDLKKQADANDAKKTYTTTAARWWNEVILYGLGPLFGVALALGMRDTDYFPEQLRSNTLVVVMAGICLGFTCGYLFKIFKKLLSRATGVDELDKTSDIPKPPGGE